MKKIILPLLIVVTVLASCNMSDTVEDLGHGYQFVHEGEKDNWIVGRHKINANVGDYDFNEKFILACQYPDRKVAVWELAKELNSRFDNYSEGSNTDSHLYNVYVYHGAQKGDIMRNNSISEKLADSIINSDPSMNRLFNGEPVFWIISHKDYFLYGPFSEDEYLNKRKDLNIPDNLRLTK